jgi:ribosomal protein S27AE
MTYTIEHTELTRLLEKASHLGAKRALEEAGVVKKTITLATVKKLYGEAAATKARMSAQIDWLPIGKGGTTSGVMCLSSQLDTFLTSLNIDAIEKPRHNAESKQWHCPTCSEKRDMYLTETKDGVMCGKCGSFGDKESYKKQQQTPKR